MIPFFATSFYTGPVAKALGGADISFGVGLIVSGVLYQMLNRTLDLDTEAAAIAASERELEGGHDSAGTPVGGLR